LSVRDRLACWRSPMRQAPNFLSACGTKRASSLKAAIPQWSSSARSPSWNLAPAFYRKSRPASRPRSPYWQPAGTRRPLPRAAWSHRYAEASRASASFRPSRIGHRPSSRLARSFSSNFVSVTHPNDRRRFHSVKQALLVPSLDAPAAPHPGLDPAVADDLALAGLAADREHEPPLTGQRPCARYVPPCQPSRLAGPQSAVA